MFTAVVNRDKKLVYCSAAWLIQARLVSGDAQESILKPQFLHLY